MGSLLKLSRGDDVPDFFLRCVWSADITPGQEPTHHFIKDQANNEENHDDRRDHTC
jgi:hypothetical protein